MLVDASMASEMPSEMLPEMRLSSAGVGLALRRSYCCDCNGDCWETTKSKILCPPEP